jgi:hypothetical protein
LPLHSLSHRIHLFAQFERRNFAAWVTHTIREELDFSRDPGARQGPQQVR